MVGSVAFVTLDRPDKLNALTSAMYTALLEHFTAFNRNDQIRAVVLHGAGRGFCSGVDLGEKRPEPSPGEKKLSHQVILAIAGTKKPVIASVRGACVGIGFSLALTCDLIVASRTARFSLNFKRIGLVPDGGALYFLWQQLGLQRAKELVFSGRTLPAEEALALGLVARVVDDDHLKAETDELATDLANSASVALSLSKSLLQSLYTPSLETFLDQEAAALALAKSTVDHREGIAAFKEKRAPHFVGK